MPYTEGGTEAGRRFNVLDWIVGNTMTNVKASQKFEGAVETFENAVKSMSNIKIVIENTPPLGGATVGRPK